MGKTKKVRSSKSPKSPVALGKKTGCLYRKTTAAVASEAQQSEVSNDGPEDPVPDATTLKVPARVVWDRLSRKLLSPIYSIAIPASEATC